MDELFMKEALALAREAFDDGEVPVGCVIVRGDEIVGRGRNRREKGKAAYKMFESSLYYDPQMAKPARFCPSCGGECYAPSLICIRCERR